MMDTLTRLMRHVKPMYYRILFRLHGFKFYPVAGGEETVEAPEWLEVFDGVEETVERFDDATKTKVQDKVTPLSDPEFNKYKTPQEFYKGYREKVALIGRKGIIVPAPDAKPEEQEKFLNSLGRPEKPDGYKYEVPKDIHASIKVTPEATANFNAIAHKTGLTNTQANALNGWYLGQVSQILKDQEKAETVAAQTAETALRAEWKDQFDAKRNAVADLILKAGGQAAIDAMGGVNGLGNNPHLLKALGVIAGMLSEDQIKNLKGPGGGGPGGNETQEQAAAKIKEMETVGSEAHKALMDEKNPKHDEMVKERTRLYKIAYAGGEA